MISEVHKLLRIYLTLSGDQKRIFVLATMTENRLNHIVILHTHTSYTDKLNISDIAREFFPCNERGQSLFGLY